MASPATRRNLRLKQRSNTLTCVAVAVLMITVAVTALIASSVIVSAERDQVEDHVSTGLGVTHKAVSDWVARHLQMAERWAASGTVAALAQRLVEVGPTRTDLLASPEHVEISSQMAAALAIEGYPAYSVVDRDGLILSSNLENDMGTQWRSNNEEDLLKGAWEGNSRVDMTPVDPYDPAGLAMMEIVSVITSNDGEPVAALIFTVDPSEGFADVLRRGSFGDSGETYAFDRDGHMISPSRFTDQLRAIGLVSTGQNQTRSVSLRDPGVDLVAGEAGAWPVEERPLTQMAAEALVGRDGSNFDGYRDYRGVDVVGAWLWDESLGLGITTEVDSAEAFSVAHSVTRSIAISTIVIEILILAMAIGFFRKNRALEQLLESKTQLLALVSHELRTPLTSIVGFTDLLLHDRDTLSPDDVDQMIFTVAAESSDLAHIVEDLLVAARTDLEDVPVNLERVELASAAQDTIGRMSELPPGHLVAVNGEATADADTNRVRQILRNLISNAVRHGGDRIHIEIAHERFWVTLSVQDDGDEIPSSERDRIFEPFAITAAEDQRTQSIGLGLPVSRRLATLMGGCLTYRYQNNESIFELQLPRWNATTTEDATAHQESDYDATAHSESLTDEMDRNGGHVPTAVPRG